MLDNYTKEYTLYSTNNKTKPLRYNKESDVQYVCKVNAQHKEILEIDVKDGSGNTIKLHTPQQYNNNFREALPQIATIMEVIGDGQFKIGDTILTYHFAFVDYTRTCRPFKTNEDDDEVYVVDELQVLAKINDSGEFEPRNQVVLCEPIYDKLINTSIELTGNLEDYRRDLVKVIKSWKGCEYDINDKEDYLILDEGGDYLFKYKGVQYVFVDFNWDSAIAIVNNKDWRDMEVRKHMKDHNDLGYGGN